MQILIIFLLLLVNGLFSMAEIAVVSARKARLQQRAAEGDRRAAAALKMAEEPDEFLSTVQMGITLIGILAGAFGGATLSDPLAQRLAAIPALAPYANALAVAIVVIIITFLSLVIGELVPKRLGLNAPENDRDAGRGADERALPGHAAAGVAADRDERPDSARAARRGPRRSRP